ncbi:hypothetical protein LSAT2_030757, partial [Lamellibrachia satsuma]
KKDTLSLRSRRDICGPQGATPSIQSTTRKEKAELLQLQPFCCFKKSRTDDDDKEDEDSNNDEDDEDVDSIEISPDEETELVDQFGMTSEKPPSSKSGTHPSGKTGQGPSRKNGQGPSGKTEQGPSSMTGQDSSGNIAQGRSGKNGQGPSGKTEQGPSGKNGQVPSRKNGQGPSRKNGQGPSSMTGQDSSGKIAQGPSGEAGKEPSGKRTSGKKAGFAQYHPSDASIAKQKFESSKGHYHHHHHYHYPFNDDDDSADEPVCCPCSCHSPKRPHEKSAGRATDGGSRPGVERASILNLPLSSQPDWNQQYYEWMFRRQFARKILARKRRQKSGWELAKHIIFLVILVTVIWHLFMLRFFFLSRLLLFIDKFLIVTNTVHTDYKRYSNYLQQLK